MAMQLNLKIGADVVAQAIAQQIATAKDATVADLLALLNDSQVAPYINEIKLAQVLVAPKAERAPRLSNEEKEAVSKSILEMAKDPVKWPDVAIMVRSNHPNVVDTQLAQIRNTLVNAKRFHKIAGNGPRDTMWTSNKAHLKTK